MIRCPINHKVKKSEQLFSERITMLSFSLFEWLYFYDPYDLNRINTFDYSLLLHKFFSSHLKDRTRNPKAFRRSELSHFSCFKEKYTKSKELENNREKLEKPLYHVKIILLGRFRLYLLNRKIAFKTRKMCTFVSKFRFNRYLWNFKKNKKKNSLDKIPTSRKGLPEL